MKASLYFKLMLIFAIVAIGIDAKAQEENSTRYVKIDSSGDDAVLIDNTDYFESKPICRLTTNQTVTLTGKSDGNYVQIKALCDGKEEIGWIKESALTKKPVVLEPRVTISSSSENASFAQPGTIGYQPIDTTGMRVKIKVDEPKGTGRTTGVIGTLPVTNNGKEPIPVAPQTFFIPTDRNHQPYVGRIAPGQSISPGQTIAIPITGFCIDIHKPPVPAGASLPPISSWVSVRNPVTPADAPPRGIGIVPGREMEPFSASDIPSLSGLPGFDKQKTDANMTSIPVWPGTDIPISGTLDLDKNETEFAPMIVDAVMRIEKEAYNQVLSNTVQTPFSGDNKRELEALTQQTVWITMAGIQGQNYPKEHFSNQVITQYEENTGTNYDAANEEVKKNVADGIDQFWSAFYLVGLEAKVISVPAADPNGIGANQAIAISTVYDDVNDIEDYDGLGEGATGRKKYDEYVEERELNGKTHEQACKKVGVKTDSSLGKSFRRVYKKQKSK